MKILFMGTAEFAVPSLEALTSAGHTLVAVVTQPDRPKGRSHELAMSAVKETALRHSLPVLQPEDVNDANSVEALARDPSDVAIVAAYGQKLSPQVLAIPRLGCLNVHASLLPKYRGAAPVAWAIINGEPETGVTVMRMAPRIDAGAIVAQDRTAISVEETAGELEHRLAQMGARLLLGVLNELAKGPLPSIPQKRGEATYARRLLKEDGLINWNQSAQKVSSFIRGMTPWPGAFAFLPIRPGAPPLRILITKATTREQAQDAAQPGLVTAASGGTLAAQALDGQVVIVRLKPAGGREMTAAEFLRGHKLAPGSRFTGPEPPE
ncbi:MAG: methionyl-tRNA formyltransferase [Planctomycetes bacterium]|nr:methionyl-tRNA formyltransferase [Planctomycetota bacterium]